MLNTGARCAQCRATDLWQLAYGAGSPAPYARRIHGLTRKPTEWLPPGGAGFPKQLAAQFQPGAFCAGCFNRVIDAQVPGGHPGQAAHVAERPEASPQKAPPVARTPRPFDLDAALRLVRSAVKTERDAITVGTPQAAEYASPSSLRGLHRAASRLLTRDLFAHQQSAIQAGLDGDDVVISTATASGKSLCYQTLAAHHLAAPGATVLYIAPINALLVDQMDAFERFFTGCNAERRSDRVLEAYARKCVLGDATFHVARYDGGVPKSESRDASLDLRKQIRTRQPRLLLSNPEMLVQAILPRAHANKGPEVEMRGARDPWAYFFRGLRLVVIDELHAFRGVFGAHLANVLRRVRRLVHLSGGDAKAVRFFGCSATIRDPGRTASAIMGSAKVTVIGPEADRSAKHHRKLLCVSSDGEKLESFAARLLPVLVNRGNARSIVFRDHIPALQGLGKQLQKGALAGKVETYSASHNADVKMDRLWSLRRGDVECLLTTSALELGIDVGDLNASVLLGFPGSVAKTWQMLGRAGRAGDGLLIYVAGGNYLDQHWFEHAKDLFGPDAEPEDVIVDPDNEFVVAEHLRAAALDHPLDKKRDARFFGPKFENALNALAGQEDGLRHEDDVWILRAAGEDRAVQISLRSLGQYKVPVYVGARSQRSLFQEESHRAPRRLFRGAVFVWDNKYYRSEQLVIPAPGRSRSKRDEVHALVTELENPEYLTTPHCVDETTIIEKNDQARCGEQQLGWGVVSITTRVEGYFKSTEALREIEGGPVKSEKAQYIAFGEGDGPPHRSYRTQGAWFELDNRYLPVTEDEKAKDAVLRSVAETLVRAAPLLRFASPGDLAAASALDHENFGSPVVFVNETVLGGAGLAKQLFERRSELVDKAIILLEECKRCGATRAKTNGCPLCVILADGAQDRAGAVAALRKWQAVLTRPGAPSGRKSGKPTTGSAKRNLSPRDILEELGYRNVELHRTGGMAQVWLGYRGDEKVALKLELQSGGATTRGFVKEAMNREAKHLEKLKHPNILAPTNVHRHASGVVIELPFADGGNLADFVRETSQESALFHVFRQITDAVAYLHRRKIVHRDLKDGNILFSEGLPKVSDFGIAKDLKNERATTRGFGSESWAAPEQETSTTRAAATMDVFSLGKVLVYMFTHDPSSVLEGGKGRGLELVPAQLRPIVKKCLSKDPAKRFADASALLQALPEELDGR